MKRNPKLLFHYCSVDSFFNIIISKSLWLSNSSQMNDAKETTWIETYFDFINSYFTEPNYKDFTKYLYPTYGWNKKFPFIICLSELKDSLSQWRAYAADGKGVCIGIAVKNLGIKPELPSANLFRDRTIGLSNVEYNQKKQKKIIQELTENFKSMYDKKEDELWSASSTFLALELVKYSLTFKNPSFEEEKEWRIIHTPLENKDQYEKVENKIKISDIHFRTIGNKLTTYGILDLHNKFNSGLIPEIVLGPKSEIDIEILKSFLKANNLSNTKIIKSESTYR